MKLFYMLGIMVILATVNVQAATIVLKDGRTITGDIVQQDKTKVTVKEGDFTATYYSDEIVSITDKEGLIEQLLSFNPTYERISDFVKREYNFQQQQYVLSSLAEDKNMKALTKLRIDGLRKYFSAGDLKAVIGFFSLPEGKRYLNDIKSYYSYTLADMRLRVKEKAKEILKNKNSEKVPMGTSIIMLKDGKIATGAITQEDNVKLVLQNGRSSSTYSKDDIASIDGGPLVALDNDTGSYVDKKELVDKFFGLLSTEEEVSDIIEIVYGAKQLKPILSAMKEDQTMQALTNLRSLGMMRYLTAADLNAAIKFYSSDEGKQYLEHQRLYYKNTMKDFYAKLKVEADTLIRA